MVKRKVKVTVEALLLLTALVFLYDLLLARRLPSATDFATVVATLVAGAQLLTVPTPNRIPLEKAERRLADEVKDFWELEAGARNLTPRPLAVRWRLTEFPGTDEVRLEWTADRADELARWFRGLRPPELVILGDKGMGKTSLAVLILTELLKEPRPGEPLPVFLSLSDWKVGTESLFDWFVRRLNENYPFLRAEALKPATTERLLGGRRILPVLDGLDELAKEVRPQVLQALSTMTDHPLVLTCRTGAYKDARKGAPLWAAPAIEPLELTPAEVRGYLTEIITRISDSDAMGEWKKLLGTLGQEPLSKVLTTPLMVWLLIKGYVDTREDPGNLLKLCESGSPGATSRDLAGAIQQHLVDKLIASVIEADQARDRVRDRKERGEPKARHPWDPTSSERWLSFLAYSLPPDLAWWQLRRTVPLRHIKAVLGVIGGGAVGIFGTSVASVPGQLVHD